MRRTAVGQEISALTHTIRGRIRQKGSRAQEGGAPAAGNHFYLSQIAAPIAVEIAPSLLHSQPSLALGQSFGLGCVI
jgi:hypothetical protein